ncbi:hypothetical protein F4819DRAFT_467027 [Hypoxylon fuscum]|nr:hypothetical protein F4819DRAFT_467027 [Hypoxylon fuscum]
MSERVLPKHSVHRIGFTLLSSRDAPPGESHKAKSNIIFVHGLRGHPQKTWEETRATGDEGVVTLRRRNIFQRLSRSKNSASTSNHDNNSSSNDTNDESSSVRHKVFWPRDYLIEDIPEANVWTYGYNADVIGGLFQADNQNGISQHGRDLAVKVERELENEVRPHPRTHSEDGQTNDSRGSKD